MPSCSSGDPQGDPCNNPPDKNCKVNSGQCNAINTDVYSCVVSGPPPSDSESVQVSVGGPVTALLSSTKTTVQAGETATLTWSSTGAEYCTGQQWPFDENAPVGDLFVTGNATSGSDVVKPAEDTEYGVFCYGPDFGGTGGGSSSCSPQSATYNPVCNADAERKDITCPDGYKVQITAGRSCNTTGNFTGYQNSTENATCVACEGGSGGGGGGGNDYASDTLTITVNEPQCSDNEDNDFDGDADEADDGCTPGDPNDNDESDDSVTANLDCTSPNSCSIAVGSTAILTWSSVNATTCVNTAGEGAGGFSTGGAPSGTDTTTAIADNATYQIQCTGPDGSDIDSADILVRVPVVDIWADAYRVATGNDTTVHWTSENALTCEVSGPGLSSALLNGEDNVTISKQQEYEIDCEGATKSIIINPTFNLEEF